CSVFALWPNYRLCF
ncbi:hypothetical protein D047_4969B, partial [Vibrio parahaemolyticus VPTS-2010_2]